MGENQDGFRLWISRGTLGVMLGLSGIGGLGLGAFSSHMGLGEAEARLESCERSEDRLAGYVADYEEWTGRVIPIIRDLPAGKSLATQNLPRHYAGSWR